MNNLRIIIVLLMITACSSYKSEKSDKIHDIILREYSNTTEYDTTLIHEKALDYLITASKYETQIRYPEAILELQEALTYDSSAGIYYALAKNYLKIGKIEKAKENVLKSLIINDKFAYGYQLLASIYLMSAEIEKSIAIQEKLIEIEPTYTRKLELAKLYEYVDKKKSISIYESLLNIKENSEILFRLSLLYSEVGSIEKLPSVYEKLITLNNKMPEAYELMFRSYFEHKQYQKAMDLLDTVNIYFVQDDVNYFYNIVGNELLDSDEQSAIKSIPLYLNKITNEFYFDWRINMISGYLADKINDSTVTDKFFTRALESDTIPDIPLALAYFYIEKDQHFKSLEILNKFEINYPLNHRFPLYKGIIYSDIDSNLQAKDELLKALKLDTSQIEIWGQLGLIYDKLKIYDSCDISYYKVLTLEPDNPLINNNYAYSLSIRGVNLDKALSMSALAIEKEPNNPSFLDTYAWIQYQIGNYEISYNYMIKAIEAGGTSYEVYEHLGYILNALDRKQEAKENWIKSLEINPNNDLLRQKIKELKD